MSPRASLRPAVQALLGKHTENLLDPTLSTWSVIDDIAGVDASGTDARTAPVLAVGVRASESGEGGGADAARAGSAVEQQRPRAVIAGPGASAALRELGLDAAEVVATHTPSAAAGSVTTVPLVPARAGFARVLLAGLGAGSASDVRAAGAAIGRATRDVGAVVLALGPGAEQALVEGVTLGSWSAPAWHADGPTRPSRPPQHVHVLAGIDVGVDADEIERAVIRCRATLIARGLGLTPSNIKNPAWLASQARALARRSGLTVQVWDERDLARDGFGGLLAVGGGSATPPRLVQVDYVPGRGAGAGGPQRARDAGEDVQHVVLVGKGITFDTGGINVKPADGMLTMKTDMAGSAAVLAVLASCRALEIPVRVTGLLALAENQISGGSYRPSDVISHYGGRTTEVGNTDAEGRLVLADAMAYAVARLAPDVLVDIATLTGAARVALARSSAAILGTSDAVVRGLQEAGESTGETFWRLPLVDDYREALSSDVADRSHIAPGVGGGAITAALFLQEFVGEVPWAHLDIAGPGRSDVDQGILAKGATGFGTRALLAWLEGLQ